MNDIQQRAAARAFAERWQGKGYEKGESQPFWLSLLRDVFGIEHPEDFISFEDRAYIDHAGGFIDGYIAETRVLIEQKSFGKDLNEPILQSDGSRLTPFQQAREYVSALPYSRHPRWVVTCNFAEFYVYDMERPGDEPEKILLADLERDYYRLQFLIDAGNENLRREMELSFTAGEIVGNLYDAFLERYNDPTNERTLHSLNVLCVRLVFCLYAEDAGIFGRRNMFHDYIAQFEARHVRNALIDLFKVLDTVPEERDPYMNDELAAFPYVNGGLFEDESIEIPQITDEIKALLLTRASEDFDWSEISPTIFGSLFESTLNPETRRSGGMHYTSIENIHKVIDPLFLDDLKKEFEEIAAIHVENTRRTKLKAFQRKLGTLTFLDPAAGSGNFLTETYLCLRKIENDTLRLLSDQIQFETGANNPIQVTIDQFYGIEINDFAVSVAKTALWIAESQMIKQTEDIFQTSIDFLPLKTNAQIVEGNALRFDWESLVPKDKLKYIMGNPPFVGYAFQSSEQKEDLRISTGGVGKNIDYVAGWYYKAANYMKDTNIHTAFVSTNSITQGEQVAIVWKPILESGFHIDFAYHTFRWDSEANIKAQVHCVIVAFSNADTFYPKKIYQNDLVQSVKNINGYLLDAPNIFIERRARPLCDVPAIYRGSQPTDDGNLILTEEEKDYLLHANPEAAAFVRPFMMGKDFINQKFRYCIWLVGADPTRLKKCPLILERVNNVKIFRENSKKAATREKAKTPTLFDEIHDLESDYIAIPVVSSENRTYIPIGYLSADIIAGNKLFMLPDATLYHFGILTSSIHMDWMRTVCGRLKSDYSYSNTIVYNNFPWPSPSESQKTKIEQTAQAILDARALYPEASLAELYDDLIMPQELRNAHINNDRAVMQAYGFSKNMEESEIVTELMRMYQELVDAE